MNKILSVIIMCCVLLGCSSTRQYEFTPAQFQQKALSGDIKLQGRTLLVTENNGAIKTIRVTAVENDGLIGKSKKIYFSDIRTVELKEIDAKKNLGLLAGIYLLIVQSR